MFPMSQVIYAMAEDRLLFGDLPRSVPAQAPPSSLFELSDLVDFLSVVTLLAYTLMAFSVLVLR